MEWAQAAYARAFHTSMELLQALPRSRVKYVETNCIHCGLCVKSCPTGAIEFDYKTRHIVFDQKYLCVECCSCVYTCRSHAMVLMDPWELDMSKMNE